MTALTGETGAGKTLVVEALQLVLGGRADPRHGAGRRRRGPGRGALRRGGGRRRPRGDPDPVGPRRGPVPGLGGRPHGAARPRWARRPPSWSRSTGSTSTAPWSRPRRSATSSTPSPARISAGCAAIRSQLHALDEALAGLGGDAQQRAREADVLRYQVEEIAAAHLEDPDEEAALRLEEDRLADAAAYRDAALEALDLVDPAGEGGALDLLGRAGERAGRPRGLRELPRPAGRGRRRAVRPGPHAARRGRGLGGRSPAPHRRAGAPAPAGRAAPQVRRGPGAPSSPTAGTAPSRLAALEDAEGRGGPPAGRARRAQRRAGRSRGGRARRAGAGPPVPSRDQVGERLGALAMAGARLEVRVAPDGTGEPVELALGANVGEAVQPLARAASGGELARAMLAIRLVGLGGPQTMVFDEVDAGVGGAAALALGEALHEVGRDRQVLVVTHLAQVASLADAQISVVKRDLPGPHRDDGDRGRGRGPRHRAVPDALGAPGQRRRPCARPRAARRHRMGGSPPRVPPAVDYRGRVHRSCDLILGVPKAA